jgi:hypothetical protein
VEKESQQAGQQKMQAWGKVLGAVGNFAVSFVSGRKVLSQRNMSKSSTAFRGFGRSAKESQDVERAEENLEALLHQRQELESELEAEVESIRAEYEAQAEELEIFELAPRRTDVDVRWVALAWLPHENHPDRAEPAW